MEVRVGAGAVGGRGFTRGVLAVRERGWWRVTGGGRRKEVTRGKVRNRMTAVKEVFMVAAFDGKCCCFVSITMTAACVMDYLVFSKVKWKGR